MYRYMGLILSCSVISNSIDMELYREKENKKPIKIKLLNELGNNFSSFFYFEMYQKHNTSI